MNAPIANPDAQRRLYEAHCWAAAIRFAAGEVDKLAAHFVGNTKTDATRDSTVYEQGIGCERAGQMLREVASLIERQCEHPNDGTQRPGTPDGSLATETRKPGSLK